MNTLKQACSCIKRDLEDAPMNVVKTLERIKKKQIKTRTEEERFLGTSVWKRYTVAIKELRGSTCELCETNDNHILHLHHLKPEDYYNLDPNNFVVVCPKCHKKLHKKEVA